MNVTEVKKSSNHENVEYISNVKLQDKKSVYTQAQFYRIKSNKKSKLSLKIGRYKKTNFYNHNIDTKIPETEKPKSELTLDNDELNELVDYINANYYPLANNENKYLSINDESLNQLVKDNPESIKKIINIAITNEFDLRDVNKIIELSDRKKAIEQFRENFQQNATENVWQKWFEENSWVLGTDFVRTSADRRINVNNISDFIVENIDGFVDVIEIKRPSESMIFFENKEDHGNLIQSRELTKALTQLSNYLVELEKKSNDIDTTKRIGKILKPRGILIFGNSRTWTDKEFSAFRILNSSLSNITVYTYNMILHRAIKMNEYLSVDKNEK